jgi:hypothetical protein
VVVALHLPLATRSNIIALWWPDVGNLLSQHVLRRSVFSTSTTVALFHNMVQRVATHTFLRRHPLPLRHRYSRERMDATKDELLSEIDMATQVVGI